MTILTRLRVSLESQVDALVAMVENHDAVAASLIHERERAIAKARYNLSLLKKEVTKASDEANRLAAERVTWLERAKQMAANNREKALECVKRAELCKEKQDKCHQSFTETAAMTKQLEAQIVQTEESVESLKLKQKVLRTREARNQAARLATVGESGSDAERVFQRWEERVETGGSAHFFNEIKPTDELEQGFRSEEERGKLVAILNEITAQ